MKQERKAKKWEKSEQEKPEKKKPEEQENPEKGEPEGWENLEKGEPEGQENFAEKEPEGQENFAEEDPEGQENPREEEPEVQETPEKKKKSKKEKQGKKKSKKKKRGSSLSTIILVAILLGGLGIMLYPSVSDWWNSMHATQAIAGYVSVVEDMSAQEKEDLLKAAKAYNARLANGVNFVLTEEEYAEYESLLDVTGTGIMGYVQISAIGVNLPIYHSVDEGVLQIAVGHVPGSSLPVGGERTHAVLSGHRGLPSARLFTDLDRMVEGDTFTINIMDETITYMVDQIRIVLPEEVDDLAIQNGKDYCTLVTCTPYGINTHRMLVRGKRIENIVGEVVVVSEAVRIPTYVVIPAIGVPMLFLSLFAMLLYYRIRRPKKSRAQIMEDLKKGE